MYDTNSILRVLALSLAIGLREKRIMDFLVLRFFTV